MAAIAALCGLPATAAAVDREAITSYDRMAGGAPYHGYFDNAWQGFVAQSDYVTHIGVTVGNPTLPPGSPVGYAVTLRLCTSQPDVNGNCAAVLAQASPQIVNYGNSYADIGDVAVTKGQEYWVVWFQPPVANGMSWVTYWWSGGATITQSDQMQMVVRGYDASAPPPPPPPAGQLHHVYHTCANGACGLRVRAGPGYSSFAQVGSKADGDAVQVACQTRGERVFGVDGSSSDVWDRLVDGAFVADYYVDTSGTGGAFSPDLPRCAPADVPAPPPTAAPQYTVTSTNGLKLRLAPFIGAAYRGAIPYGAPVSVECQLSSEPFGGSAVWDRIDGGYFLPDAFVSTPGRDGAFSATLPACSGGAPPGAPPGAGSAGIPSEPPIASGPAPTCRQDVVFIGARGSGEGDHDFGPTVRAVLGSVLDRVDNRRIVQDGLDYSYPAMSVPDAVPNFSWNGYGRSVAAGTTAILLDMGFHLSRFRNAHCPNPVRFLLVGYSQGAWAVGDAYLQMSDDFRRQVAGMALFGDPRNHGSALVHGIYDRGHPWPEGVSGNVWNSCRASDPVCHADPLTTAYRAALCITHQRAVCAHLRYAGPGQEATQAGRWLAGLVS